MDAVLLGHFQGDYVEKEFGHIRQCSGGNYYVSVRQVFETVRLDKAKLLVGTSGFEVTDIGEGSHECELCNTMINPAEKLLLDQLLDHDISDDIMLTIVYVAGFIAFKLPLLRGEHSNDPAFMYLNKLNRGKLSYPTEMLVKYLLMCYLFFYEVESITMPGFPHRGFLEIIEQHNISVNLRKSAPIFVNILLINLSKSTLCSQRESKKKLQKFV